MIFMQNMSEIIFVQNMSEVLTTMLLITGADTHEIPQKVKILKFYAQPFVPRAEEFNRSSLIVLTPRWRNLLG